MLCMRWMVKAHCREQERTSGCGWVNLPERALLHARPNHRRNERHELIDVGGRDRFRPRSERPVCGE